MKKLLALTFLLSSVLSLTGCIDDDDGRWDEYNTPELFLSHAIVHHYITVESSDVEGEILDYDLYIKDAILDNHEFKKVSYFRPTGSSYIIYNMIFSYSIHGVNYANMSIYRDGSLRIECKTAFTGRRYFCYKFDSGEANTLIDTINSRITLVKSIEDNDDATAKENGSISNFLSTLENTDYVVPIYVRDGYDIYRYTDSNRTLLNALKDIEFTLIEQQTPFYYETLLYNLNYEDDPSVSGWYLELGYTFDLVEIIFDYTNSFNYQTATTIWYSIDSSVGESLYNLALEIAPK